MTIEGDRRGGPGNAAAPRSDGASPPHRGGEAPLRGSGDAPLRGSGDAPLLGSGDAPTLLLVEDDTGIGRMLERGLQAEGYRVRWARDLREAAERARAEPPDLVVLDRMLPDGDGAAFCAAFRRSGASAPVLMLTARETLEDKLRGFDAGADDYLTKPFEFDELAARLAALRRRGAAPPLAALRLDPALREAQFAGRSVRLTPREWPLIAHLHAHAGQPVSREALIAEAWGMEGQVTENSVDVYVGYLRRKLGDLRCGARIETVRGVGFMLVTGG